MYLAEHPGATSAEIGKFLGVSKQRVHTLLKLLGIATQKQRRDHNPQTLTTHELEILRCIASGMSNSQVAKTFGVTESTIKNQVTVILAQLNANNRAHAVALAIRQGLILLAELKPPKATSK